MCGEEFERKIMVGNKIPSCYTRFGSYNMICNKCPVGINCDKDTLPHNRG